MVLLMKSTYEQIKDFEKCYRKQYLKCLPIYYYISLKIDFDKKRKISIIEKTIQSLDGFLSNNRIEFTNGEILVKDLISLYK